MVASWKSLAKPEQITIVAPDGNVRCQVTAYYAGSIFIIDDMKADLEPGDELRRVLPNGKDDVYRVDDPKLFDTGHMPAHYQVKVSRKGSFAHETGGYLVNVSGANARVNIGSTDKSTNIVQSVDVFADMRHAIETGVTNSAHKALIMTAIDEAERSKGSDGFVQAYQKIVGTAADHLGLLMPFLPALTGMLG